MIKQNKIKFVILACLLSLSATTKILAQDGSGENIKSKTETEKEEGSSSTDMFKNYVSQTSSIDRGEHFMINTLVGTFSGMSFGALFSFSEFIQHDYAKLGATDPTANLRSLRAQHNKDNLVLYLGLGGLAGAFSGMIITLFELNDPQPFMLGTTLLDFSWYGALSGFFIGSLGGLIPYSDTKFTDEIWHYAGYGSAAGLAVGVVLWVFFRPAKIVKNFSFRQIEDQTQLVAHYVF